MKGKLIIFFFIFLIGCNDNGIKLVQTLPNNYALKDADSIIVLRGSYLNNKKISNWEYLNDNGKVVCEINYLDTSKLDRKTIKYYNSKGRLIYLESYEFDNQSDLSFIDYTKDSLQNIFVSRILHEEYCKSCHDFERNTVSKSYKELIGDDMMKFEKNGAFNFYLSKNLNYHEDLYPILNKDEISQIINFIVDKR